MAFLGGGFFYSSFLAFASHCSCDTVDATHDKIIFVVLEKGVGEKMLEGDDGSAVDAHDDVALSEPAAVVAAAFPNETYGGTSLFGNESDAHLLVAHHHRHAGVIGLEHQHFLQQIA